LRTETTAGLTAARVFQQPPSRPDTVERRTCDCELPAGKDDLQPEHPATLIVAALEQLEAQRAAMQWLLEADLLRLCLV
jgi:hypothetical protein